MNCAFGRTRPRIDAGIRITGNRDRGNKRIIRQIRNSRTLRNTRNTRILRIIRNTRFKVSLRGGRNRRMVEWLNGSNGLKRKDGRVCGPESIRLRHAAAGQAVPPPSRGFGATGGQSMAKVLMDGLVSLECTKVAIIPLVPIRKYRPAESRISLVHRSSGRTVFYTYLRLFTHNAKKYIAAGGPGSGANIKWRQAGSLSHPFGGAEARRLSWVEHFYFLENSLQPIT